MVHAKKFQLVNWVPTKLGTLSRSTFFLHTLKYHFVDIPVILPPDDILELDAYLGRGLQEGETELPEAAEAPAQPEFNADAMAQLEGMGFPTVRCQKALLATGNSDANAAMEWLFMHMEDPGARLPCRFHGVLVC